MIRAIIIFIFIYLCLKVVKDLVLKSASRRRGFTYRPADDNQALYTGEMVQDPVCQVYISKQDAVAATISGQDYFFCSKECLKKFKEGEGRKEA